MPEASVLAVSDDCAPGLAVGTLKHLWLVLHCVQNACTVWVSFWISTCNLLPPFSLLPAVYTRFGKHAATLFEACAT